MLLFSALAACASNPKHAPTSPPSTPSAPTAIVADWDGVADGAAWTQITLSELRGAGQGLLTTEPADIDAFCPSYRTLDTDQRAAFWVALISGMTRFESTFDPKVRFSEFDNCQTDACRQSMLTADSRKVVSRGLLQLSQESANAYRGCSVPVDREESLHDPALNLHCGVVILTRLVTRDGVISRQDGSWKGGAAYWSVLRPSRNDSLAKIQRFTAATPACRAGSTSPTS
jgi:hypothetical protein